MVIVRALQQRLARPQVIQGMTLVTLFKVLARNDFRVDRECLGRLAHLCVLAVFNSIYGACEAFFNMDEIEAVSVDQAPLFVIGHWRSGTTHLHNLLSLDENFIAPTAYQCLFPSHFVFSQVGGLLFNLIAPKKRPMDNVPFASYVPHEDEFALAAHSGVSPYMRFLFPISGDESCSQLDPTRLGPESLNQWKRSFMLFLKKLTLSEKKRIVLKSPPHFGRIKLLLELFPDAQFVHILRDPYVVYRSTWKLWQDSLYFSHLQMPDHDLVDELILSWYEELFSLFERDRHLIPQGALHEMKFEDLEERPLDTLSAMYKDLNLPAFEPFQKRAAVYLESIRDYEKNTHNIDQISREKVSRRWRETFERYGYPL
jgi:omega-hydroxy-beta-dihydromenaquinone-9 sulfotransferase